MKVPRSISLDTDVLEAIRTAAGRKRESVSKWLEDAALQRMELETSYPQPIMIPKLPIKKAAQLGVGHDVRQRGRSKRGKTSRGDRRSNEG